MVFIVLRTSNNQFSFFNQFFFFFMYFSQSFENNRLSEDILYYKFQSYSSVKFTPGSTEIKKFSF